MKKPVEAIERIRGFISLSCAWKGKESFDDVRAIIAFIDSLPDEFEIVPEGRVCVKWPELFTRERLLILAERGGICECDGALHALAAIAPERKKRMVDIYRARDGRLIAWDCSCEVCDGSWRKVAGPIEIED